MLKGSRKYWLIAIVCGFLTAFFFYQYLQEIKARYLPDDLISVVKAARPIARDTVINEQQLLVETLPAKYVHPDAIREIEAVAGKIAITDISVGEGILKNKLLSSKDKSDHLAYAVPVSKRAVSIPINDITAVSGFIKVGDRVDIIATLDIPLLDSHGNEKSTVFSIFSLQNIEVLSVGENLDIVNKKNPGEARTLTLAVSVQDAQALVLASEKGNLRLLLRSPVDDSRVKLPPLELKNLLGDS